MLKLDIYKLKFNNVKIIKAFILTKKEKRVL